MNIQSMMQQAQKLQKEMTKAKKEIDEKIFIEENDFLKLEMYGNKKIKSINIKKINDDEDYEILEDMIQVSVNKLNDAINSEINKKMGKFGNMAGLI